MFFFCQLNSVRADLFLCPFRSHPDNNLIKSVCNFAIGTDKHCFSCNGSSFGNAGLIVVNEVLRNCVKSVRITDDRINMSNRLLAFLNLMLICAFNSTTVIIVFNFPNLCLIKRDPCSASVVDKVDCDTVFDRLCHCVGIDNRTEDFNRAIYGRTGKTDIGCVGERIM